MISELVLAGNWCAKCGKQAQPLLLELPLVAVVFVVVAAAVAAVAT